MAEAFPCHATIFKQPNITKAKTVSKIKSTLFELTLLRKRIVGPYQQIPKPILLKIAAYASAGEGDVAQSETYELAKQAFNISH